MSLDQAISAGIANVGPNAWRPFYWKGGAGSVQGWYIKRGEMCSTWLRDDSGKLIRRDTETEAIEVIASVADEK